MNTKKATATHSPQTTDVRQMFNDIAPNYDFLNHFLSAGIDKKWRKKTVQSLKPFMPQNILDVATGTGDLAIRLLDLNPKQITGIDISEKMMAIGIKKVKDINKGNIIQFKEATAEDLPFPDQCFDGVTVAFGVRNFVNLDQGLKEMHRVLKNGGHAAILEFSMPTKFPAKQGFRFYFKFWLPLIGKVVSKSASAYKYLPVTINAFPQGEDFSKILINAGFSEVNYKRLTFGIATLYLAKK